MRKATFAGMTLNERLAAAGLLPRFEQAARERDRASMVDLLSTLELADQAETIVDRIFADPDRYDL